MYYCKYVLVYTYMYWYTHICIPHPFSYIRQTHTRILALVDTCKYAFSVHTHTHGRTRIHSSLLYRHGVTLDHMRVCTHMHRHTHTHVSMHTLIHTCMCRTYTECQQWKSGSLMCCSLLQCIAVCCSVLQCVAMCCCGLQWVAVGCSGLQCVAVCVARRTYAECLQGKSGCLKSYQKMMPSKDDG